MAMGKCHGVLLAAQLLSFLDITLRTKPMAALHCELHHRQHLAHLLLMLPKAQHSWRAALVKWPIHGIHTDQLHKLYTRACRYDDEDMRPMRCIFTGGSA